MRSYAATLALASSATAQYSSSLLASNPGGAIPAGVQAPSTSGFINATIQPSRGGLAVCVSGFVSVEASTSKNLKLNLQVPQNQSQVTEIFLEDITTGSPFTKEIMGGMQTVKGTYEIGATYCTPANNTKPEMVQILTHGVGFDRYYWDFAPGYSYVDYAAQYSHATFFYDRLGVGKSEKADPLNVVQSPLEVEIANNLATKLRQGSFSGCAFKKVVGAGHSFGSIITQAVTAQYPATLDAAILTGFSVNATGMPPFLQGLNLAIASQNQPYRFANLNNAYLVSSTAISNQIGFFRAPGFDPTILVQSEAQKGTVTLGELLTTTAVMEPAKQWTKPVAVVNGAEDLPFCLGNCTYPVNKAQAVFPMLYPAAKVTGSYFGKDSGHGLNLHYSAVEAYQYIQDFIVKHVK